MLKLKQISRSAHQVSSVGDLQTQVIGEFRHSSTRRFGDFDW